VAALDAALAAVSGGLGALAKSPWMLCPANAVVLPLLGTRRVLAGGLAKSEAEGMVIEVSTALLYLNWAPVQSKGAKKKHLGEVLCERGETKALVFSLGETALKLELF
jgi:hypothetical protein